MFFTLTWFTMFVCTMYVYLFINNALIYVYKHAYTFALVFFHDGGQESYPLFFFLNKHPQYGSKILGVV